METYHDVILAVVALVLGALGMPLTNYLKDAFGWDGKKALLLAGGVAFVLAVVELVLAGQFNPAALSVENFPATFGLVYASAMFWYRLLKSDEPFVPEVGYEEGFQDGRESIQ